MTPFGRRNLMMLTIVGFAVLSGLTAFLSDRHQLAICQLACRDCGVMVVAKGARPHLLPHRTDPLGRPRDGVRKPLLGFSTRTFSAFLRTTVNRVTSPAGPLAYGSAREVTAWHDPCLAA
jgi:hypothetical protein